MPPDPKEKLYNDVTDAFSSDEQKKIVTMVIQDIDADVKVQEGWIEKCKRSLQHKHGEKPSVIEGISKKKWQSDRNLGVGAAVADIYQSTLLSTCYNPDSIHMIATEENDIPRKDDLEKFVKWMLGKNEVNALPEVDDYVQNKIDLGFSTFEIYRSVWWEWVDRHVPKYGKDGKVSYYQVKTEKVRFEKAVLENIDNLDDLLMPRYGDSIQKLPHIIRILHLTGDRILEYGEDKKFMNITAKMVLSMKNAAAGTVDDIEKMKGEHLDLTDVVDEEFRALPIDVYRWYGWYKRGRKREKYRFLVHKETETFLSGKPLRKITKSGKYPFVGGPFEKVVGQLRGDSLYDLINDPVNAINETWNQKADFQYVTNCPFGFHKNTEGYTKGTYILEPGVSYPTEGNPNEEIFFPNLQRSMAWAEQDIRILFEVIEKRTGAATYFQTNERNASGTATRDKLVASGAETRFGKWSNRIQDELCEAFTMCLNIYQEHVPDRLGERVLGENGKKLFPNLSVETLRYSADARMEPDITAGSKMYERQVMLWAYQTLQASIWFNPQINPKGNWLLTQRVMKSQGMAAPEMYLPPEPKEQLGMGKDVDSIWSRLSQGEEVEPEDSWNIPQVLAGLYKKKGESYFDLDEEYRPNLDILIVKTEIAYQEFIRKVQEEQMASQLAQQAMMGGGQAPGQPGQGQPLPQQQIQPPQPGGMI